jgi:sugar phosphate isomerase/epimerase
VKVGASTSVLADKRALDGLLAYEPELVEFYTYPSEALPAIAEFCRRNKITPALHVPTPHAARMAQFCPTGPDALEAAAAVRALRTTVACAADLGAQHVVVHFPSPYPPFSRAAMEEFGPPFLAEAADLSRRHAVPVLIENLTPNPYCATPAQYADALAPWPELGLCLDVGHAFLLNGTQSVAAFADTLGVRVRSMHLYDPSPEPPLHRLYPAPGTRRAPRLPHAEVERALRVCRPATVVLEHDPTQSQAGQATIFEWLQRTLPEDCGNVRGGSSRWAG